MTAPDGTVTAVRAGGRLRLCSAATSAVIREIPVPATVAMAFHPDGTMLATADSLAGTIRLWNFVR